MDTLQIGRFLWLLLAMTIGFAGVPSADEPADIPVSCIFPRATTPHLTGKRLTGQALEGHAVAPALSQEFTGPPGDSLSVLAILIEWDDHRANSALNPASDYRTFLFSDSPFHDETLRDYYREVSYDRFRLGGGTTVWLRSNRDYHYFVNGDGVAGTDDDFGFDVSDAAWALAPYPANVWGLVRDAVEVADANGVDFSRFDNDGPDGIPSSVDDDGIVDALIVIHAGTGAEAIFSGELAADQIWSHKSDLTDDAILSLMGATSVDGVRIGPYILVPENGQLGVYAHEFGHILGLPDLYGTFVENGSTVQQSLVGTFDLMDAGALTPFQFENGIVPGAMPTHIGSFLKEWLGWTEPVAYSRSESDGSHFADIRLEPAATSASAVRIHENPGGNDWNLPGRSADGSRYYQMEYRKQVRFDRFLPGEGIAIWEIDEDRADNNTGDLSKRLLRLVEADNGLSEIGIDDLGDEGDLWPAGTARDWTPTTTPSTANAAGLYTGISVTDMSVASDAATFDLDLTVERPGALDVYPNPYYPATDPPMVITFLPEGEIEAGSFEVRIFGLDGELVRILDLDGSEVMSGDWSAFWNGTNDRGEPVASGVYFLYARAAGHTKHGRIAILR